MVALKCNPSPWVVEAGGLGVRGRLGLHEPCLKVNKQGLEMDRFKAASAPPGDLDLVPSTHVRAHSHL